MLEAIVEKAKSNPTKLINAKFLNTISDSTNTDLTFDDMLTIASKYISAAKTIKTDHLQGTEVNLVSGSSELIPQSEKQRGTNVLRKSLGLKAAKTGPMFAGEVSSATLAANGLTSYVYDSSDETTDTTSEDGSTVDDGSGTYGSSYYSYAQ